MNLTKLVACIWCVSLNITGAFSFVPVERDRLTNDSSDSIRVTNLLKELQTLPNDQNKILFIANKFQGTPYQGGTLETFPVERLVVRTDSVDCTTFVEYVLAVYVAGEMIHDSADTEGYARFKQALENIRYRHGKLNGYVSRLHYFSDWIADNERKGIVREVTKESPYAIRKVDLNFMSNHVSAYPYLANDSLAVQQMKAVEAHWYGYEMPYISKENLNKDSKILKILDGDILTLVTNIKGLDVVHVGYACWVDGKLHLLHASSAKKKVILDPLPLFDYSKNKKIHIGIRAIRVI